MERTFKRMITYSILFIVCLLVAVFNDGDVIGYVAGIGYLASLFIVLMNAITFFSKGNREIC